MGGGGGGGVEGSVNKKGVREQRWEGIENHPHPHRSRGESI